MQILHRFAGSIQQYAAEAADPVVTGRTGSRPLTSAPSPPRAQFGVRRRLHTLRRDSWHDGIVVEGPGKTAESTRRHAPTNGGMAA